MPRLSIKDPSLNNFDRDVLPAYCTKLPDSQSLQQSNTAMCLMITPILRGSTVYIRGTDAAVDKSKAPSPALCHLQVGAGLPANKEISLNLHKYAAMDQRTKNQV